MGKLKFLVFGEETTHPLLVQLTIAGRFIPKEAAVANKGGIREQDGILPVIIANHILLCITANGLQRTIYIQVILPQSERKHLTSKIHKYIRGKRKREII